MPPQDPRYYPFQKPQTFSDKELNLPAHRPEDTTIFEQLVNGLLGAAGLPDIYDNPNDPATKAHELGQMATLAIPLVGGAKRAISTLLADAPHTAVNVAEGAMTRRDLFKKVAQPATQALQPTDESPGILQKLTDAAGFGDMTRRDFIKKSSAMAAASQIPIPPAEQVQQAATEVAKLAIPTTSSQTWAALANRIGQHLDKAKGAVFELQELAKAHPLTHSKSLETAQKTLAGIQQYYDQISARAASAGDLPTVDFKKIYSDRDAMRRSLEAEYRMSNPAPTPPDYRTSSVPENQKFFKVQSDYLAGRDKYINEHPDFKTFEDLSHRAHEAIQKGEMQHPANFSVAKRTRDGYRRVEMRNLQAQGHRVRLGDSLSGGSGSFVIKNEDGTFVGTRGSVADAADAKRYTLETLKADMQELKARGENPVAHDWVDQVYRPRIYQETNKHIPTTEAQKSTWEKIREEELGKLDRIAEAKLKGDPQRPTAKERIQSVSGDEQTPPQPRWRFNLLKPGDKPNMDIAEEPPPVRWRFNLINSR